MLSQRGGCSGPIAVFRCALPASTASAPVPRLAHAPLPFASSPLAPLPQGQLLDELDTEIEGTSTRIAAAQKKVGCRRRAVCHEEAVLQARFAAGCRRRHARCHANGPFAPRAAPCAPCLGRRWSTCCRRRWPRASWPSSASWWCCSSCSSSCSSRDQPEPARESCPRAGAGRTYGRGAGRSGVGRGEVIPCTVIASAAKQSIHRDYPHGWIASSLRSSQ